ncbi:cystathionine beta-lyase [Chimaeribacter californicus]|uniref:Cystathionine beta-lyase n=1 Tax=Chimaeribacter californicus TaxID=2060067 RepID=A0A2N5E257_9GAMM|nr:cystathionine beta-lyase [Chimaeribacter californicus]PLR34662.1 cystathionine beta-lyase [Chimaeribacter californicus]
MKPAAITQGFDTRVVQGGRASTDHYGFVNPPVFRGSTVLAPSVEDLLNYRQPFVYGRLGSPTTAALQDAVRELDGSAGVLLCSSGLAAIALALQATLGPGDRLLMSDVAYRPARRLCEGILHKTGVVTEWFDHRTDAATLREMICPSTRAIYLEAPGSQTMEMSDLPALIAVAHEFDLIVILDNTWATPLFFDAFAHGADIVIQAATKYLAGHSDVMLGIVSASSRFLPALQQFHRDTGVCVSPDDAWLTLRGLRTLAVRLRQHQESALHLARWLAQKDEVQAVWYPALESDEGYALWQRDFSGAASLFTVILQPASSDAVAHFLEGLELFGLGYSWGGFESLALPFDCSEYRHFPARKPVGPCIRFYIGLENVADLQRDLEQGLQRFKAAR